MKEKIQSSFEYPVVEENNADRVIANVLHDVIKATQIDGAKSLSKEKLDDIRARISTAYSENGRYYHTLKHVLELIAFSQALRKDIHDIPVFVLAILGHDLVYDVNAPRGENETESAKRSSHLFKDLGISTQTLAKVRAYIIATIDHDADSQNGDLLLFLDSDMAILGAPWERYLEYARGVRKEYGHVSDEVYTHSDKGRLAFLQTLLQKDMLFRTSPFKVFEDQAQDNMQKECIILEEGGMTF